MSKVGQRRKNVRISEEEESIKKKLEFEDLIRQKKALIQTEFEKNEKLKLYSSSDSSQLMNVKVRCSLP